MTSGGGGSNPMKGGGGVGQGLRMTLAQQVDVVISFPKGSWSCVAREENGRKDGRSPCDNSESQGPSNVSMTSTSASSPVSIQCLHDIYLPPPPLVSLHPKCSTPFPPCALLASPSPSFTSHIFPIRFGV